MKALEIRNGTHADLDLAYRSLGLGDIHDVEYVLRSVPIVAKGPHPALL